MSTINFQRICVGYAALHTSEHRYSASKKPLTLLKAYCKELPTIDTIIKRHGLPLALQRKKQNFRFSATFYEGKLSLIQLRFFSTTDQGSSASIGMQGYYNGQYKSYVYSQDRAVIPNNYALTWDPATNFFAPTRTNN
ncbi:hypothetical protein E8E11_005657 [Didymella keratinophila]|nr:hypothetical protein E8E11_005657 [Didymella keratinophila]